MNATRRPDAAAAAAIAAPAVTWSAADSSRAGVTTTTGAGDSPRPPMNHSGIKTPQSIGATAVDASLEPKLTAADGKPADANDSSTRQASSVSDGTSSSTGGVTPFSLPFSRAATITASALEMCTLCGVATTTTSGFAKAKRRPSSSIPSRVLIATSRSSGEQASAIAIPPSGAIAANTSPVLPIYGYVARSAGGAGEIATHDT